MRLAARMTTGYDVQQDRLCLSVLDRQRRRTRIWLTQRLAGRIIPALLQQLQGAADQEPLPARPAGRASASAVVRPRRRAPPAAPVAAAKGDDGGDGEDRLPTNIRIGTRKGQTILIFDGASARDESIVIPIDGARLRQWLRIFYKHYKRAGWPLEIWPRWFERDAFARPPSSALH